jgi:[ribosomal protein S18]-alanine N-acetyltransferase
LRAGLGGAGGEPVFSVMSNWRRSGVVVREARPRDLDAIERLENAAFETDRVSRRSLREFLRASHRPVIAATIGDELAGYALVSLRRTSRALRIYSLAVDARFVRRGVARALLMACEAYARRWRRAALTLEVRYDNASAIALYESSGFRQFGEHAHYYADGAAALRYEKSLDPASRRETGNNPPPKRVRPLRGASGPR